MKPLEAVIITVTSIGLVGLALALTAGLVGVIVGELRTVIGLAERVFAGMLMLVMVCIFVWTFNPYYREDKTR